MKRIFRILLVILLLSGSVFAQKNGKEKLIPAAAKKQQAVKNQVIASYNYLYNPIIIITVDGDVYRGFFVSADSGNINAMVNGQQESFNFREISSIKIKRSRNLSNYGVTGMLWGLYLGNHLLFRNNSNPTAYMDYIKSDDIFQAGLYNILSLAVGVGLGYIVGAVAEPLEAEFNLEDPNVVPKEEFKRFLSMLQKKNNQSAFHLNFSAGRVYSSLTEDLAKVLESQGMIYQNDNSANSYYSYYEPDYTTNGINLLRNIDISYNIKPEIEVGIGFMWLGNENLYRSSASYYSGNTNIKTATGSFNGTGYFAKVQYSPIKKYLSEMFDLKASFGMGWANLKYNLTYQFETKINNISYHDNRSYNLDESKFATNFGLEAKFILSPHSSLSLYYEITYMDKVTLPASFMGNEIKLSPTSSSLGLNFGINI